MAWTAQINVSSATVQTENELGTVVIDATFGGDAAPEFGSYNCKIWTNDSYNAIYFPPEGYLDSPFTPLSIQLAPGIYTISLIFNEAQDFDPSGSNLITTTIVYFIETNNLLARMVDRLMIPTVTMSEEEFTEELKSKELWFSLWEKESDDRTLTPFNYWTSAIEFTKDVRNYRRSKLDFTSFFGDRIHNITFSPELELESNTCPIIGLGISETEDSPPFALVPIKADEFGISEQSANFAYSFDAFTFFTNHLECTLNSDLTFLVNNIKASQGQVDPWFAFNARKYEEVFAPAYGDAIVFDRESYAEAGNVLSYREEGTGLGVQLASAGWQKELYTFEMIDRDSGEVRDPVSKTRLPQLYDTEHTSFLGTPNIKFMRCSFVYTNPISILRPTSPSRFPQILNCEDFLAMMGFNLKRAIVPPMAVIESGNLRFWDFNFTPLNLSITFTDPEMLFLPGDTVVLPANSLRAQFFIPVQLGTMTTG